MFGLLEAKIFPARLLKLDVARLKPPLLFKLHLVVEALRIEPRPVSLGLRAVP
jgi:hypothetical protein